MSNRSRKVDAMGRWRAIHPDANAAPIHPRWPTKDDDQHMVRTPGIGVCRLGPAFYDKWIAQGGAQGPLGLPVLDEQPVPDGRGRFALFEWGGIYAAPHCGVHAVHGVLFDRWLLAGGAPDLFGYPCTDVRPTADGRGSYCHFEFGTLYTPDSAAVCVVLEPLRSTWLMVRGPDCPAGVGLMLGTDVHWQGFGHWLMHYGGHDDSGHHVLCGQTTSTTRLLPQ